MPRLSDLIPQATAYLLFTILGFTLKYLLSPDTQILTKMLAGDAIMVMSLPKEMQNDFKSQGKWLNIATNIKGRKCKVGLKTQAMIAMDDHLFLKVKDSDLFELGKLNLNPRDMSISDDSTRNLASCQTLREIHYGL